MTATKVPAIELRISISETEPLIWRQLVLPQTATLADLHEVIQAAFGWKNAHLFDFHGKGEDGRKRAIGILDDESPEGAESATEVGVLELFNPASPGRSPFEYVYDFGDHWTHEIEVVGGGELPEKAIVCVAGAMRGPLEDSGGVGGYSNLVRVIGDTKHPEHQDAAGWLEWVTSEKAKNFDPTVFDLHAVNADLDRLSRRIWAEAPSLEEMNTVLAPILWLLGEAHPDGLDLTAAGWLKPAIVKRMMTELNWDKDWYGTGRNEVNIPHVSDLREQLQRWKLLRKNKNKLLLTPAGRRVLRDPADLWDFLAARVASPDTPADEVVTRLVVHWELTSSKPKWENLDEAIRADLSFHGFVLKAGNAAIPLDLARDIYFHARRPLDCLALWGPRMWKSMNPQPTDAGIKFLLDVQNRWDASNR